MYYYISELYYLAPSYESNNSQELICEFKIKSKLSISSL